MQTQVCGDRKYDPAMFTQNDDSRYTHHALLRVILAAKKAGDPWADMSLAQLATLTGHDYRFVCRVEPNRTEWEIVK